MIPIKADSFDDFSHLAKKECGMCYEGVKGPRPVLRCRRWQGTHRNEAGFCLDLCQARPPDLSLK